MQLQKGPAGPMLFIGWAYDSATTLVEVYPVSYGAAGQGSAMVAPRPLRVNSQDKMLPRSLEDSAQWMSLRHAASELDVSTSTVRRWMRRGKLRSRVAARGRRFYYQVWVEHVPESPPAAHAPIDIVQHLRSQLEAKEERLAQMKQDLRRQEEQIRNLSAALANALRRSHGSEGSSNSPYTKYRWLARRGRWWPFR